MATNAANVTVAYDGAIMLGPTSSAAPTGTGGQTTGFVDVGYLTEDSFEIKPDAKTEDIKAWQRAATVRKIMAESSCEISFKMQEVNAASAEAYFGAKPTAGSGGDGSVKLIPSFSGGKKSLIVDIVDGKNLSRFYFPSVELVGRESIKGGAKDALSLGVTFTAYPDAEGSVGTFYSTLLKTS